MQLAIVQAVLALVAGANVELEANVRSETRAGTTPTLLCDNANDPFCKLEASHGFMDLEVNPLGGVSVLWPTVSGALRYTPLLVLRRCLLGDSSCTTPDDLKKPLILHQAELHLRRRVGRLNWVLLAGGAIGDSSFSDLRTRRSTVPLLGSTIIRTRSALLAGRISDRASAHHEWALEVSGDYSTYNQQDSNATAFPGQAQATLTPAYIYHPDRANEIEAAVAGGVLAYTNLDPGSGASRFPSLEARLGWRHRFGTRVNMSLRGGMIFLLDAPDRFPTGEGSLTVIAYRGGGDRLTTTLTAGVTAYASPIEVALLRLPSDQVFVPRASISIDLLFTSHRNFSAGVSGTLYSSLIGPPALARGEDVRMVRANIPPDLSIVTLSVPIIYRFGDGLELGLGVRASARSDTDFSHIFGGAANDLRPKGFQYLQLEAFGYLGLTARFGRGLDTPPRGAGRR